MQSSLSEGLTDGVVRNASFSHRPPSPPFIHIPTPLSSDSSRPSVLTPSYSRVDPSMLTPADLKIITGGRAQKATDLQTIGWEYENRRVAQPVLDFLYLGPLSAVRDLDFLREEGITMLLTVRDVALANMRIMSIDKAVAELGLDVQYLNIVDRQQFIQDLPATINRINDHLLRVYKSQLQPVDANVDGGNSAVINPSTFKRGKVMVFCETGNDRGAAVVVAYLMAMYGIDMVNAAQFVSCQRFCVILDESTKQMLQAYGDILNAQRMINRQRLWQQRQAAQQQATPLSGMTMPPPKKRGYEETLDEDDEQGDFGMDSDRFEYRPTFAPYTQGSDVDMS